MSIAQDRAGIVAALNTVPGVSATSTMPASPVPGSAWPVWLDTRWATGRQLLNRWYVLVALPATDQTSTVGEADELLPIVGDALWTVGKVALVEPFVWPVEPGQQPIPALRFTLEI